MVSVLLWVRLGCAVGALLLTWLTTHRCAAQHDARVSMRGELAHFSSAPAPAPLGAARRDLSVAGSPRRPRPWLWAAAGTTAAFAASYAVFQGLSYRATNDSMRASERSNDFALDYGSRASAREQGGLAAQQAALLSRVSDICLAGTIAATGTTLLIWLTSKRKRQDQQMKTLLGPMVLRGAAGGGLVLREKF
jgi:hypothetical protein